YLTNTAVLFDNQSDPPQRYALFTFYRYEGNLAILVTIRLDKITVTNVATHPHMPTSLAPEEIAEAEKLAPAHPEIKRARARNKPLDKFDVDMTVSQIIDPGVPVYHHRVARFFFRDAQRNSLPSVPMVDVDLTSAEVRFAVIASKHRDPPTQ